MCICVYAYMPIFGIVKGKALNSFALGCGGNPHLPPQASRPIPDSAPILKAKCVVFTHFAGAAGTGGNVPPRIIRCCYIARNYLRPLRGCGHGTGGNVPPRIVDVSGHTRNTLRPLKRTLGRHGLNSPASHLSTLTRDKCA